MSDIQLYRKLKALMDVSPGDFIRGIRLDNAAKLLKTSTHSLQEIMDRCGFSNKSYFYRRFSEKFGMSPIEYRKKG